MVHQIYRDALTGIQEHERKVCQESRQIIEESYRMIIFIREVLIQLKGHVLKNGFSNKSEEIEFFRRIKPEILGKLIYYNKLYRIETA
ncbi:hypothetical protein GCM10023210_14260 [Chryseobacterium ginsengisoli]|uniref:Tetracycline regulation of excision, RteC n=1 Tax=Chryseobacterium ginsengisoli TaxID=363853 RepID=A0ABP9M168_9FLAO